MTTPGTDPLEGLTAAQWEAYVAQEGVHARGAAIFDRDYFADFGRYPEESPLYGTTPAAASPRRQAILNLIERGATEGERDAARAALARVDQDAADEDEYLDALYHGAA